MTQDQLARAARIPRPNLSAVERGDREVTLKTLRALALALNIMPGVLADGIPPKAGALPLSRTRLERIARAAARGVPVSDVREAALASDLRQVLSSRLRSGMKARAPRTLAAADRAYFRLRGSEDQATVASLVDRVGLELERR